MMNRVAVTIVALFVLVGCGDTEPDRDLSGEWTRNAVGYENGAAAEWVDQIVVIGVSDDNGFAGYKGYVKSDGVPVREQINGVIDPGGDVVFVDGDGTFRGRLDGDTIVGIYVEPGDDSTAMTMVLTRVP